MYILAISLVTKLLLGFPFIVLLLSSLFLYLFLYMPDFQMSILAQQMITGIVPRALVCIPMFILAASIITSGKAAKKLVELVRAFIGHIPGGLAVTTAASCTLFGAVSGSTQATVAAIGGAMRPMLRKAGYPSTFTLGLIINASDIAFLIPPSIGFIIYGVITGTSIGALFLAGVLPGLLILALFSVYCIIYAKVKKIPVVAKVGWRERLVVLKESLPVMGFPFIVMGGIYTGFFSPTEAAAASVAYAVLLEGVVYRSLTWTILIDSLLSTGIITAVVMVLVGAGQGLSWLISFLRIPQEVLPAILGSDPSQARVLVMIILAYFIGCMFFDPAVVMYVVTPIFAPYVLATGINPILLGVIVTLQVAIGSATPPFGCDIFTAQLIFRRPYLEVIGHTYPFIMILLLVTLILILCPQISLFLPSLAH